MKFDLILRMSKKLVQSVLDDGVQDDESPQTSDKPKPNIRKASLGLAKDAKRQRVKDSLGLTQSQLGDDSDNDVPNNEEEKDSSEGSAALEPIPEEDEEDSASDLEGDPASESESGGDGHEVASPGGARPDITWAGPADKGGKGDAPKSMSRECLQRYWHRHVYRWEARRDMENCYTCKHCGVILQKASTKELWEAD